MNKIGLVFALLYLTTLIGFSQTDQSKLNYETSVISPYQTVKAGDSFKIVTKVKLDAGWYAYYKVAGAIGNAASIKWETPEGITLKNVHYPVPTFKTGPSFYYQDEIAFVSEFETQENILANSYSLEQTSSITICKGDVCVPGKRLKQPLTVQIGETTTFTDVGEAILADAVKYLVPSSPTEGVKVSSNGETLSFHIPTSESFNLSDELIFIPDNKRNLNKEEFQIEAAKTDTGYQFNYTLPSGHKVEKSIEGILTTHHGKLSATQKAIYISALIDGEVLQSEAPAATGHGGQATTWTDADKAEHAKLYDASIPIQFENKVVGDNPHTTEAEQTIVTILLFAFIGGLLLNLMPCVFPVLGLKIMGFVQLSGNDPKKIKIHGLVFTLGVLVSMWILAVALLIIKRDQEIIWGQQMGNPIFVGGIIILLFIMGLNMYGVFEIGTKLTSAGGNLQNKKGYSGSFFSGVLTTLIATPCSGPFLGLTMSYTLAQEAPEALLIFTVFALGISSPYLFLAFAPALINKLPNPGAWMEVFKKFMAFPLFATAVFFLRAFSGQTGMDGALWLSMALVLFGMAAWAYGTWSVPYLAKKKRYIWGMGFPLVICSFAVWMTASAMNKKAPPQTTEGWQLWHPGLVEHHLSKKRVVWVDYTADW